ncbi:hypothetical protein V1Y59_10490 [Gordonia sp. PKS22-38]|uniref:Uncharacterized protein n=1 Tax=Gordonia prachuapensis TaxID=3115651 RepID=A0ABU7MT55_9ACTN|nr:hypothetical protein [Gordonia sp. PKS22-38]
MDRHHRVEPGSVEPDFNAVDDDEPTAAAHRRQILTYSGVTLSLIALLVLLLANM